MDERRGGLAGQGVRRRRVRCYSAREAVRGGSGCGVGRGCAAFGAPARAPAEAGQGGGGGTGRVGLPCLPGGTRCVRKRFP